MTPGQYERDFCGQKLDSVIIAIKRLLAGDYPHNDSRDALSRILTVYESDQNLLKKIDPAAKLDTILEFCRRINVRIVRLKTFLGLLIRSSNLRNAFEIYFPVKSLATELLDRDVAVVLSSEWDFSPYVYPIAPSELKDFIFIGIPASECQNPLIIPLAGHELGHVVWGRQGVKQEFDPLVRAKVLDLYKAKWNEFKRIFGDYDVAKLETDLFLRTIWGESLDVAQRQLEEIFCDFLGVYVFGQSFLHSFRYLLAPSLGHIRNVYYPSVHVRAKYMQYAATKYGLSQLDGFTDSFNEQEPGMAPDSAFIVGIADDVSAALYSQLVDLVKKYKGRAPHFADGVEDEKRAIDSLNKVMPIAAIDSISAIVNAGWTIRLHIDQWDILSEIDDQARRREEKIRVLRDLVLKSFEVFEYRRRLDRNATKRRATN